jgi:hypothetical protein
MAVAMHFTELGEVLLKDGATLFHIAVVNSLDVIRQLVQRPVHGIFALLRVTREQGGDVLRQLALVDVFLFADLLHGAPAFATEINAVLSEHGGRAIVFGDDGPNGPFGCDLHDSLFGCGAECPARGIAFLN